MKKDRFYLAYGSNLSVEQMLRRCPDAVYVGWTVINEHRLLFKGSRTGSYLTIEESEGDYVPCLVWKVSEEDEDNLDRYEGYPIFYGKAELDCDVFSLLDGSVIGEVEAFVYAMRPDARIGIPAKHYYNVCLEGYRRFGFNENLLKKALDASYDAV